MLVPLTAIVTSSLPLAAAIALCAKDRKTVNKNKSGRSSKSQKTRKSGKSGKTGKSRKSGTSSKSGKSSKSKRSGSKSKRSSRSKKSKKSSKSKKAAAAVVSAAPAPPAPPATFTTTANPTSEVKSEKSERSEKSTKTATSMSSAGSKSSKRARRLDADAQKKLASTAETKSAAESVATIKHTSSLAVAPARLQYQTVGGVNQIELKNTSTERKAYKVKCSDNALYRVNPVYGFADPKSSVKIDVLRLNGEEKTDKLVLLTANAKDGSDPRQAFNNSEEPREMMVVPLVAQ